MVQASKFSHCSLVDAISVEEGGADFASWDGLLYDASGTTLLRVPAGATEITIRDGCTTIAAGALEGCAKLERINAPASVTSISPDVFTSIPTVSLPAASVSGSSQQLTDSQDADDSRVAPVLASGQAATQPSFQDEASSSVASGLPDQVKESADPAPQITAMVALSFADDDLPEVNSSSIEVTVLEGSDAQAWEALAFTVNAVASAPIAFLQAADGYGASYRVVVDPNGHTLRVASGTHTVDPAYAAQGGWINATEYDDDAVVYPTGEFWAVTGITRPNSMDASLALAVATRPTNRPAGYDVWTGWVYFDGEEGWTLRGFATSPTGSPMTSTGEQTSNTTLYAIWRANAYTIAFDSQGGSAVESVSATYDQDATLPTPARTGYRFTGWDTQADGKGIRYQPGIVRNLTANDGTTVSLYAQWQLIDYGLGFDTSSEPNDPDYPGDAKEDQSANVESGQVPIEDPKRPGYVFEGWVIPNTDGTEAVDQELVYQGDDGKWYVDASRLPDYAGDDGRVELTARWTSVISVDVPSSVTFYADLVTQGQESREGAASGGGANGAFGQNQVANQSQVDLRLVGLESSAVETEGSTLGADSILKKADAATPSTSTQKLLSLYPSAKQWTADELRDPDAVGGSKPPSVDFDLDDILLEKSFTSGDLPPDAFTIAAGDTLNMGYRLNLTETGQQLDYDKLSTLSEGQSASIANVSYTFASEGINKEYEPLWFENTEPAWGQTRVYGLEDIKKAADDLSANASNLSKSTYYSLYKNLLDSNATFHLKVDARYYDAHLIGICQDAKTSGGKAGLTFELKGVYDTQIVPASGNYSYSGSNLQKYLQNDFYGLLDERMRSEETGIVGVTKRHQANATMTLQTVTNQLIFVPSLYEIFGVTRTSGNWNNAENSSNSFQYQYFAKGGANVNASPYRVKKDSNGVARIWVGRSAQYDSTLKVHVSGAFSDGSFSRVSCSSSAYFAPCFAL